MIHSLRKQSYYNVTLSLVFLFLSISPSPLRAAPQNPHSVTLAWTSTADPTITYFHVWRSVAFTTGDPNITCANVEWLVNYTGETKPSDPNPLTWTDTFAGFASGQSYCYRVTAVQFLPPYYAETDSYPSNSVQADIP